MKPEYDFSQGEKGKFYHPEARFCFFIALKPKSKGKITNLENQKNANYSPLAAKQFLADDVMVIVMGFLINCKN